MRTTLATLAAALLAILAVACGPSQSPEAHTSPPAPNPDAPYRLVYFGSVN